MTSYFSEVPFEICVTTSDLAKAETDSNAYIVLYGQEGKKTLPFFLQNRAGDFDAGVNSSFKVPTKKMSISLFLLRMLITNYDLFYSSTGLKLERLEKCAYGMTILVKSRLGI